MEYLAGGDLMTLLMKKDILTEEESKFFMAECILAVDSVHKLNYIHRDLKPDNVLIGSDGHIKLSDFGLCKNTEVKTNRLNLESITNLKDTEKKSGLQLEIGKKPGYRKDRLKAYSTVGTPDYIAPEVFGKDGYTLTVDWWSLGVILFEMLVGYPPFFSEDPSMTCQKILHWRKTLVIPLEANLSPQATDLIRKMVNDQSERLGINGVGEIKAHPFFFGINWREIRKKKAPWQPELTSDIDTRYFDKFEEEEPWFVEDPNQPGKQKKNRKDDCFIGYTFNMEVDQQRSNLVTALLDLENTKNSKQRVITNEDAPIQKQSFSQILSQPPIKNEPPQKEPLAAQISLVANEKFNNTNAQLSQQQNQNQMLIQNQHAHLQQHHQHHQAQQMDKIENDVVSHNTVNEKILTKQEFNQPQNLKQQLNLDQQQFDNLPGQSVLKQLKNVTTPTTGLAQTKQQITNLLKDNFQKNTLGSTKENQQQQQQQHQQQSHQQEQIENQHAEQQQSQIPKNNLDINLIMQKNYLFQQNFSKQVPHSNNNQQHGAGGAGNLLANQKNSNNNNISAHQQYQQKEQQFANTNLNNSSNLSSNLNKYQFSNTLYNQKVNNNNITNTNNIENSTATVINTTNIDNSQGGNILQQQISTGPYSNFFKGKLNNLDNNIMMRQKNTNATTTNTKPSGQTLGQAKTLKSEYNTNTNTNINMNNSQQKVSGIRSNNTKGGTLNSGINGALGGQSQLGSKTKTQNLTLKSSQTQNYSNNNLTTNLTSQTPTNTSSNSHLMFQKYGGGVGAQQQTQNSKKKELGLDMSDFMLNNNKGNMSNNTSNLPTSPLNKNINLGFQTDKLSNLMKISNQTLSTKNATSNNYNLNNNKFNLNLNTGYNSKTNVNSALNKFGKY